MSRRYAATRPLRSSRDEGSATKISVKRFLSAAGSSRLPAPKLPQSTLRPPLQYNSWLEHDMLMCSLQEKTQFSFLRSWAC